MIWALLVDYKCSFFVEFISYDLFEYIIFLAVEDC